MIVTSNVWQFLVVTIACASSIVYPHAPLVSFATVAGVTLNRRQAVLSVLLIWLANQLYGFTIRQYPLSTISLLWGLMMGVGAIAITLVASMQPAFSRRSWIGQSVWLGISLLLGFSLYQSSILWVNQWVGMHGLTTNVLLRLFVRDLLWAIALFGVYTVMLSHPRMRRSTR